MLPEYAVVMTLETVIFLVLGLGLHLLFAVDVWAPLWLVLPYGCACGLAAVASLALYTQTWSVQTWVQEPSWAWFRRLKLLVLDDNVNLSVSKSGIAVAGSSAYSVYAGIWATLLLHVLAIWIGDDGHVDGLWPVLFRRDLGVSESLNSMKLHVLLALTLLGVIALLLLPVAAVLRAAAPAHEDPVQQILDNRQNSTLYAAVCVGLLIQYTVHMGPLQKLLASEHKFLLFALLPLGADVLADGVLARRLALRVMCETFSYVNALALLTLSCGAPATALVLVWFEQHMFVHPEFFLINVALLTALLASRAIDCHLAITQGRHRQSETGDSEDRFARTQFGRGTKQPKFFFRKAQKKHQKEQ